MILKMRGSMLRSKKAIVLKVVGVVELDAPLDIAPL